MSQKSSRFPLSLSSVVNSQKNTVAQQLVQTPQTAMKNASLDGAVKKHHESALLRSALSASAKSGSFQSGNSTQATTLRLASDQLIQQHNQQHTQQLTQLPQSERQHLATEGARRAMVKKLEQQGIGDPVVLAALGVVQRHLFIQSGFVSQAYIDASLPIGHHQTISKPSIVARMIALMRHGRELKNVLEIGTGCGYQAAVLSVLADKVYSIERIQALHELAKQNLRPMRIPNLRLHYGDGMLGLPEAGPFDGIILAAAGMQVPPGLLQQLSIGGRLIAPVGQAAQKLQLTERKSEYEWETSFLEECHFVPLCEGLL